MSQPASSLEALYQQLMNLPERLVSEIIGGRLYRQPHPAGPHAVALSTLVMDIVAPFIEDAAAPVDGGS
jgi:hypothetical protein